MSRRSARCPATPWGNGWAGKRLCSQGICPRAQKQNSHDKEVLSCGMGTNMSCKLSATNVKMHWVVQRPLDILKYCFLVMQWGVLDKSQRGAASNCTVVTSAVKFCSLQGKRLREITVLICSRHNFVCGGLCFYNHANHSMLSVMCLYPFTPKSDHFQISSTASPDILHHTVWRARLFIAYSDERLLYY